jgi:hypothetical protein
MTGHLTSGIRELLECTSDLILVNYRDAFEDLWRSLRSLRGEILNQVVDWRNAKMRVVVVGVEPPILNESSPSLRDIDFRGHLTALSWAAAWRLQFPTVEARVALLATDAGALSGTTAETFRLMFGSEACGQTLVPGIGWFPKPSLSALLNWLNDEEGADVDDSVRTLLVNTMWSGLIADPEKHHSISNVLGAYTLGDADPGQDQTIAQRSLISLLATLGVQTAEAALATSTPDEKKAKLPATRLLLFDDMADIWSGALSQLLGRNVTLSESHAHLHAPAVDPLGEGALHILLARLESLVTQPYGRAFLSMGDFGVEGEFASERNFVLFLDLRLFGNSPSARSKENAFIERLDKASERLADGIGEDSHPIPPWPLIEGRDETADGLTNPTANTPGFRKSRTLLPRILSLLDPTLPIVLFSSTQDAALLRGLEPYRNVVTRFSKPVFRGPLGDTMEWKAAIDRSFKEAIRQVSGIVETRAAFLRLAEAGVPGQQTVHPRPKATSVEIYLDESGEAHTTPFGIGGVVVICREPHSFDHAEFTNRLQQSDRLWGSSAGARFPSSASFPQLYAHKGRHLELGVSIDSSGRQVNHNVAREFDIGRLTSDVAQCGGEIYPFNLYTHEPCSAALLSDRHPHHRYRDMLRSILETLLFEFTPVVEALKEGADVAIDAATWSPCWHDEWGDWRSAQTNLGIQFKSGDQYQAFGWEDLFPLLVDVINRRGIECSWKQKIKRARAVQLIDFAMGTDADAALTATDWCPPKQIHYLADWIAHIATQSDDRAEIGAVSSLHRWFVKGWLQLDTPELRHSLRALRYWNQGRVVEAMHSAKLGLTPASLGDAYSLARSLPVSMARWHQDVSGEDLRLLFASFSVSNG